MKNENQNTNPDEAAVPSPKFKLPEKSLEILKQEYFYLHSCVDRYDSHLLAVKGWSVTFSMAAIATALGSGKPLLLIVSVASACLFWLLDGLWKQYQNVYYYRLSRIERFWNGMDDRDPETFRYPYVTSSWTRAMQTGKGLVRILFWRQVLIPHLPVSIGAIVLWFVDLKWPFISPPTP